MNTNNPQNRRAAIIGTAVAILFCNMLFLTVFFRSEGSGSFIPFIFFGIFGVVIIAFVVWRLAISYSRRRMGVPDITFSKESLQVGEKFTVNFHHTFNSDITVENIIIQLIYKETATYQQGTDTRTVTHKEVYESFAFPGGNYRAGHIISDVFNMQIPADGMHTFKVRRNQIQWFVRIEAIIPKLADFVEERELLVVPQLAATA